jgi:hypothetical protein
MLISKREAMVIHKLLRQASHRAIDRDMMSTQMVAAWRTVPFPVSSARKPLEPFVFTFPGDLLIS